MSVYRVKEKGWRYDFTLSGKRYTKAWFKTKTEAQIAESRRRLAVADEIEEAKLGPASITFAKMIDRRLEYIRVYNSSAYHRDYSYMANRWKKLWGDMESRLITRPMVERFLLQRMKQVADYSVNQELKYLRAAFNWGIKRNLIETDPTADIPFLPVEKSIKYIPPVADIYKVITMADADTQDYLWLILHTMGRVNEINALEWKDVDLKGRRLVLYTRKKKGGHLTPRQVPMTDRVHTILSRRYKRRDLTKPWVFWHTYTSSKRGVRMTGPYQERKRIMRTLCKKAGVKYFRFHALRHAGASMLDNANVPIGVIQRILGHESRKTTEIYLHTIDQAERTAVAVLEGELEKVSHKVSHGLSHRKEKDSGNVA